MKSPLDWRILALMLALAATLAGGIFWQGGPPAAPADAAGRHLRATYDPLHFKPAIATATDPQCLACHREILEDRVRAAAPSGFRAADAQAAYQQLASYTGEQETFHRRHLVTPLARQLMRLRCNSCHQGHDPREEAQGASATPTTSPPQSDTGFVLRKQVNPATVCLPCHGQMPWQKMKGLEGPWPQVRHRYANGCLHCHATERVARHQADYLNAAAIEAAGRTDADVCYGCHGGRAWYRVAFPYGRQDNVAGG